MANHWFKFYGGEYLSDPKILTLNAAERSCWLTLLCYASLSEKDGIVRYLGEKTLMIQSGVESEEWDKCKGVLEKFQTMEMIAIKDGQITIKNWRKRQESMLTGAERTQRYRNRQRHTSDEPVTQNSHKSDARIEENRIDKNRIEEINTRFEQFWDAYPNKKTKKKAHDIWIKISPPEKLFKEIMSGLERAKGSKQWQKDEGQFIPHPTTWLNQERWNDEDVPSPLKAKPKGKYAHLV